jgi:enoyl-[acyl-carrier protein] reductase II
MMDDRWKNNRICALLDIDHPVIQGGMIYNSGARLAAAVSEAGGLGLIGAGSMRPDLFRDQIRKARTLTGRKFGVNIPLLYPHSPECVQVALEEEVKVFFTSAGSPQKASGPLKDAGCIHIHVVASPALAVKCQDAGCDAVVCEGFEAGGHNGREELTTMVLVPACVAAVDIPVIAAGGIATGPQMVAALALGADGVQIGSRFAVSVESSGHPAFKQAVVDAGPTDTHLVLKAHVPVRLLKNAFRDKITALEAAGAGREELSAALGTGRARRGMLEGDLEDGELEIGQVSGLIADIPTVREIMDRLLAGYDETVKKFHPTH